MSDNQEQMKNADTIEATVAKLRKLPAEKQAVAAAVIQELGVETGQEPEVHPEWKTELDRREMDAINCPSSFLSKEDLATRVQQLLSKSRR